MVDRPLAILVAGASGATGQAFVARAVAAGHEVTALQRRAVMPAPIGYRVVVADALDADAVDKAMVGHDAVVCTLGIASPPKGDTSLSKATANLIAAMNNHHVRRLVCQTAFGLGDSRELAGWLFRRIVGPLLRTAYEDKIRQETVVRASELDWTLVRPTQLTNAASAGRAHVLCARGRLHEHISRRDVAAFLLATVEKGSHLHEAVSITSR